MENLTIGKLAKKARVNLETIRYYEKQELLPKPSRLPSSGYRIYSTESIERIRFIKQAQELGFSLKEIKELLNLQAETTSSGADIREKVEAKIADIDGKVKSLLAIKKGLMRLKSTCDGTGSISECPILKSLGNDKEIIYYVRKT